MASSNLQQSPQPFPESNPIHLLRTAEVVIVKRARAFLIPGMGEPETEAATIQREFFEFMGRGGLLVPCTGLDLKWQNPDLTGPLIPLYKHYYVSATALQSSASPGNVAPSPRGNADVVSVSANVNTEGRGFCTIVLASPQDKYLFKRNPFRYGQAVFEPNDMVFVNLPGLDGQLNRVFTGYVSTVIQQKLLGDTLQTRVVLECEDMLKPLTQSRTAVKPSLVPSMSDGKFFSGMENDFSGRLPHDIMTEVLGLAYADFYTSKGFYALLSAARANPDPTAAAKAERDLLKSLVALPTPSASGGPAYNPSHPFIMASAPLSPLSSASQFQSVTVDPESTTQASTQIPGKVYGFRRVRPTPFVPSTAIDQAVLPWAPLKAADMDDVAFVISGTYQPAFQLAFSSSASLYFADFKSGLSICKQIADDLNYEFFANENGIVLFRPLNVSLPADTVLPKPTSKLPALFAGQVGSEYWLEDKKISGTPQYRDSDVDIFTYAYVGADFQVNTGGVQFFKGIAFDFFKFLRFGARTAPLVSRLQLASDEACSSYAVAYLSRLNSAYSGAAITYVGDSRIRAGNPCYHKSRNTIYYIASITHNFVAGESYTMNLNLKYGRRPMAAGPLLLAKAGPITDLGVANAIAGRSLASVLARLISGGAKTLAAYITGNQLDLTFQDYVWEALMPLDYESLYSDMGEQNSFNAIKGLVENSNFNSPAYTATLKTVKRVLPGVTGQPLTNAVAGKILSSQGIRTA